MYIQIDPILIDAYFKKGSCVIRKLKYKHIKRKRKSHVG